MSQIEVVQFNVLSDALASEDFYPNCDILALNPEYRLKLIEQKLEPKIASDAIICLQEVSEKWSNHLHVWFEEKDYCVTSRHYGKKFNGYMGVMIAFPRKKMILVEHHQALISDLIDYPVKEKSLEEKYIYEHIFPIMLLCRFIQILINMIQFCFSLFKKAPKKARWNDDHWKLARSKWNTILAVKLKMRQSDVSFLVATYHMPCNFRQPTVMTLHSVLAMTQAQIWATEGPLIFAGDWNFQPDSSFYKWISTGKGDSNYPLQVSKTSFASQEWIDLHQLNPMKSAYSEFDGEPKYTNYALNKWAIEKNEPAFIGCLDYIWYSSGKNQQIICDEIEKLPTAPADQVFGDSLPNLSEPSDHLLLAAKFTF